MNFNLEKNGAYKYIAFIVVSFALGFYTNVVIGNFLDDHPKVIPCDIANSQRIKKYRNMYLCTGDKRLYKEIWFSYNDFWGYSKNEQCIYEFIVGNKFKYPAGYEFLAYLYRFSHEGKTLDAKEFVDSLRIDITKRGAMGIDPYLRYTLREMKYDEHLDMNDPVIDSLINSVHK